MFMEESRIDQRPRRASTIKDIDAVGEMSKMEQTINTVFLPY